MRNKRILLAGILLSGSFFMTATAAAEIPVYELGEMVVTATRVPMKKFAAPDDISVIDRQEIETGHYKDITEALRKVSGVIISSYAPAGYEQSEKVMINGTGDVLVLIDGMRANLNGSVFNVFSFGTLKNMDAIERIEVLKGSASTLYGSDAKGGVINIITRKPSEAVETSVGIEGGNFGYKQWQINHSGTSGTVGWRVNYQQEKSKDFKDGQGNTIPSKNDQDSYALTLTKKINDRGMLTLSYGKEKSNFMYADTNKKLDKIRYGKTDEDNLRFSFNYNVNEDIKNELNLYRHGRDSLYDTWKMDLETWGISDQVNYRINPKHLLVMGVDYYKDKVKSYDDRSLDTYGKIVGDVYKGKTLDSKAIYIEDTWDFLDRWYVIAGLRYTNHSKAGSSLTPSIVFDFMPKDSTHLYLGYREYFKAPNQYHYYSRYGNENLKPEKGEEYTFGIKHIFDDTLTGSFHVFHRKARDVVKFKFIDYDFLTGITTGIYQNLAAETADGWSVQLDKKIGSKWKAFLSYNYTRVKNKEHKGDYIVDPDIPKGEYRIGLEYQGDKFNGQILFRGVQDKKGKSKFEAGGLIEHPAFPKESYVLVDLTADWKAAKDLRIYGRISNLFDNYYAEVSNVYYGVPEEWWSAPGRSFQVGVEYKF